MQVFPKQVLSIDQTMNIYLAVCRGIGMTPLLLSSIVYSMPIYVTKSIRHLK